MWCCPAGPSLELRRSNGRWWHCPRRLQRVSKGAVGWENHSIGISMASYWDLTWSKYEPMAIFDGMQKFGKPDSKIVIYHFSRVYIISHVELSILYQFVWRRILKKWILHLCNLCMPGYVRFPKGFKETKCLMNLWEIRAPVPNMRWYAQVMAFIFGQQNRKPETCA